MAKLLYSATMSLDGYISGRVSVHDDRQRTTGRTRPEP
jgi:hypothetical protein